MSCYKLSIRFQLVRRAVESAIKQIDRRLKISGAQWNADSINQMLRLRCAYLNGQLAI